MYYAVHQEDHHDSNAKSLSPGCNALNTRYFSGHDSVTIKPKEIITSRQLAQLILTQQHTLLQSVPPFVLSPCCGGIRACSVAAAALGSRASCQAELPRDWHCKGSLHLLRASQGSQRCGIPVPAGSTGPGTQHLNPPRALGFSHWPSGALSC